MDGKALIAIVFIIVLALIVITTENPFVTVPTNDLEYEGCAVGEKLGFSLVPQYGRFECNIYQEDQKIDISDSVEETIESFLAPNDHFRVFLECPVDADHLTKDCQFTMKNVDGIANLAFYPGCNKKDSSECGSGFSAIYLSKGQTYNLDLDEGESTYISGSYATWLDPEDIIELKAEYDIYRLYQIERGRVVGDGPLNSPKCNVPSGFAQCIDCEEGQVNNPESALEPGETSSYLSGFNYGPIANFVEVGGELMDCDGFQLWELDTIETEVGCVAFPSKPVRYVECCPGDRIGGKYCSSSFKWIEESEIEEVGDTECIKNGIKSISFCAGQGQWVTDTTTEYQIRKAVSCSSEGLCEYETKEVECTRDSECESGEFCDLSLGIDKGFCRSSGGLPPPPIGVGSAGLGSEGSTIDLLKITVSIVVGLVVFFILKKALEGMASGGIGGSSAGFALNIGLILAVIGGFAAGFLVFAWWTVIYTYITINFGGLFK